MWKDYENFDLVSYLTAYYSAEHTNEELEEDIDRFLAYSPLKKVYIENHRANVDIPVSRLKELKKIFEDRNIKTSGSIVTTCLVDGKKKPSIYDTFCYTDEAHKARLMGLIEDLASVFDEIILDDFFFTACRCEKCIEAKGNLTWSEYRRNTMNAFAEKMVARAHEINPKMNFIIKYPAWYKSYHETGYNPGRQRYIFDSFYTGTETRDPVYNVQHMQRYHSYAIMRWMENANPGKNMGGWIDAGQASGNYNVFLEQCELTVLAKVKELMLWNFGQMVRPDDYCLPILSKDMIRMDKIAGQLGNPIGVSVYEPFDSDGEDLLYNYFGMEGIACEPQQFFNEDAPTILLTASSAKDPDIIEKMKKYLRKGGHIVMTNGFMHETYDKGIRDLTSMQFMDHIVEGYEYMVGHRNYSGSGYIAKGSFPVAFEELQAKDNASVGDVTVCAREFNSPIFTEEDYGNGRLYIFVVPENPADLYRLPQGVWEAIARHISEGQKVYVASDEKVCFFPYDNNKYGIQNYGEHGSVVQVVVRGAFKGLRDIESGRIYDQVIQLPRPSTPGDGCAVLPEEPLSYVNVTIGTGVYRFFEVIE